MLGARSPCIPSIYWQGEEKGRPMWHVWHRPYAPSVSLDDRMATRPPHAHTAGFGSTEGLEQPAFARRGDAGSAPGRKRQHKGADQQLLRGSKPVSFDPAKRYPEHDGRSKRLGTRLAPDPSRCPMTAGCVQSA